MLVRDGSACEELVDLAGGGRRVDDARWRGELTDHAGTHSPGSVQMADLKLPAVKQP